MSNTSDSDVEEEEPTEESDEPTTLDVQLHEDFGDAGTKISDADALRIMTKRLHGTESMRRVARNMTVNQLGNSANTQSPMPSSRGDEAEMARRLIALIPKDMRTKEVLELGDIRPLLQQVASWDQPDKLGAGKLGLTSAQSWWAGQILLDETDRIRAAAEAAIIPTVAKDDELAMIEAGNLIDELVNGYRDGKVIKVNTALENAESGGIMTDPASGEVRYTGGVASTAAGVGFSTEGITGDAEEKSFLTRREVEYLARESLDPEQTIGGLLGEDFARRGSAPEIPIPTKGSQYTLTYDDKTHEETMYDGSMLRTKTVSDSQMTAREVVDLPSTMSRGEVQRLGRKLKAAGLMTEDPTDPTDFSDPVFKRAWQNLMYKSIERGESMLTVLDQQAKARKDAQDDAFTTSLTDPARVRANANALGANILGRSMNPDEQEAMVKFVHQLERRNAKIAAGFDPDAVGDLEELEGEAITSDLEARMGEWIREKNPDEAGAHDMNDSYDKLTDLLSGPGQPNVVR